MGPPSTAIAITRQFLNSTPHPAELTLSAGQRNATCLLTSLPSICPLEKTVSLNSASTPSVGFRHACPLAAISSSPMLHLTSLLNSARATIPSGRALYRTRSVCSATWLTRSYTLSVRTSNRANAGRMGSRRLWRRVLRGLCDVLIIQRLRLLILRIGGIIR